jgi:hypothetical protein
MAAGGFVGAAAADYPGRATFFVIISCIMAASGGLIFGYDIGISGNRSRKIPGFLPIAPLKTSFLICYSSFFLSSFLSSTPSPFGVAFAAAAKLAQVE